MSLPVNQKLFLLFLESVVPILYISHVSLDPLAMTCLSFGNTCAFRAVNEFGQSLCNNPNIKKSSRKYSIIHRILCQSLKITPLRIATIYLKNR